MAVLSVDEGVAMVNRIVGAMIRLGELEVDELRWTDHDDTAGFTNPSTPVITLYRDAIEVTAVCITWRRLERLDQLSARRKTRALIRACYEVSTGRRPVPTHPA